MHEEPGRSAAWDCAIKARTVDQRQAFDPIGRLEREAKSYTAAHGYTGEAGVLRAERVKER